MQFCLSMRADYYSKSEQKTAECNMNRQNSTLDVLENQRKLKKEDLLKAICTKQVFLFCALYTK